MNDQFVVLAMDDGRNWTGTANDRFGEIDPVFDLVANDRYRSIEGFQQHLKRAEPNACFVQLHLIPRISLRVHNRTCCKF